MALIKAVIDTCIIESALRSQMGASYQILSNINTNKFRFGISVALFLEYEYRIEYLFSNRIIDISETAKNSILKAIAFYGDEVPIYFKIRPNLKDENDNMVFECAANYDADYIVTHNINDFFSSELEKYRFEIIKPQQFLEVMRSG